MSLSLSCRQSIQLGHRLSHEQKLLLTQALALRLELHAQIPETPLRGLPGIIKADSILKERAGVGLLIGGLVESVWNQRRTETELGKHKDVDVLVISASSEIEEFEGGIDWWEPNDIHFERLWVRGNTEENAQRRFWVNGNGIALTYRVEQTEHALNPGLHIPSREFVVAIRVAEIYASIAESVGVVEEDEELFIKRLAAKLGVCQQLPLFFRKLFENVIVAHDECVEDDAPVAFSIASVLLEEQAALNAKGDYHIGRKE